MQTFSNPPARDYSANGAGGVIDGTVKVATTPIPDWQRKSQPDESETGPSEAAEYGGSLIDPFVKI